MMNSLARGGEGAATRSLWHNRSFMILVVAQFISLTGRFLAVIALPWFVLSTTGSAGQMVLVLLAQAIPLAIFGIPSGAIVDRVNLKKLMVVLDFLAGAFTLVVPLMATLGMLEFWMILVTSALGGITITPYLGARMSLIPALVGEDEETLTKGNTIMSFTVQACIILGPALGGALIGLIGNINVLFIDSVSVTLCAFMLLFGVVYKPQAKKEQAGKDWLGEVKSGMGFIWTHQLTRTVVLVGLLMNMGFAMLIDAVFPVFIKDVVHGTPQDLGLLIGTYGIGAIAGTLTYSALASRIKLSRPVVLAILLTGMVLPLWTLPVWPQYVPTFVAMIISAVFEGPLWVVIQTGLQLDTPADLRGRVFSAYNALNWMGTPVGLLIAGPLLEQRGAVVVMWVVVALMTVTMLAGLMSPALRRRPLADEPELQVSAK